MSEFIKTNLIIMLDREFDRTIARIARKERKIAETPSFREKSRIAAEAAELEDYANQLYIMAKEILEG